MEEKGLFLCIYISLRIEWEKNWKNEGLGNESHMITLRGSSVMWSYGRAESNNQNEQSSTILRHGYH